MVRSGELAHHLLPSLKRIGVGLLIAFLVGVPIGVAVGYFATVRNLTNTVFQFLRMISPLAWMPLAIIMFGVGDSPVYFLISVAAVWPIIINTAQGVRGMDPGWVKVVKTLGGGQRDILRRAVLPAVIPDIITGLRISVGICWVILVPAEMLGVSSGLGYFILDTRDRFAYGELMAAILVIGFVGLVLDTLLGQMESRFSWKSGGNRNEE
jgi:NitT/TauT family transport system permease protein